MYQITRLIAYLILFLPFVNTAQNANFTLKATVDFPGQTLANIWGYSAGGKEYALVGAQNGMVIIDITIPTAPVPIDTIPGPSNLWKEIKTYGTYAYVVSEGGFGVQVVNLSTLPAGNLPYQSVYPVIPAGTVNSSHALHVDETKGYLYLYGSKLTTGTSVGYPIALNLNGTTGGIPNAWTPQYAGIYTTNGYAHDGYVDNDFMFAGHIYAGKFSYVNMSNKSAPVTLATTSTPNAFTHNTWRSGNTIFTTDERTNSYLASYTIADPTDVKELDRIQVTPGSGSIVHNTYIKDNYAVTSWYRDGVVIVDVARPGNMVVTGRYDTYTSGSGNGFDGCWGVYPYFSSNTIIASNIGDNPSPTVGKLFILEPTYVRGCYLEGIVTNSVTGATVTGALVELLSSGVANETTISGGTYKMARFGGGSYTLRVSKAGFNTFTTTVSLSSGVLTSQNVALVPVSLPVSLTGFDATLQRDRTALLAWQTEIEIDNKGFDIQQSTDGVKWTSLGFEPSKGDSDKNTTYQFTTPILSTGNWLFRLAQTDLDGAVKYSDIRSVAVFDDVFHAKLTPNPVSVNTSLLVHWGGSKEENIQVELYNSGLQLVGTPTQVARVGDDQSVDLQTDGLPIGRYLVKVINGVEVVTLQLLKI
jgi:choice-of-anchor B domain-containing protein